MIWFSFDEIIKFGNGYWKAGLKLNCQKPCQIILMQYFKHKTLTYNTIDVWNIWNKSVHQRDNWRCQKQSQISNLASTKVQKPNCGKNNIKLIFILYNWKFWKAYLSYKCSTKFGKQIHQESNLSVIKVQHSQQSHQLFTTTLTIQVELTLIYSQSAKACNTQ